MGYIGLKTEDIAKIRGKELIWQCGLALFEMYGIVIAMIETLTTQTMEDGENRQIEKNQEFV